MMFLAMRSFAFALVFERIPSGCYLEREELREKSAPPERERERDGASFHKQPKIAEIVVLYEEIMREREREKGSALGTSTCLQDKAERGW